MDYIKNATDSLKLWWNHKYLWIVGILGIILTGSGNFSQITNVTKEDVIFSDKSLFSSTAFIIILIVIAIISILLAIASIYLKTRSDSALIQSALKVKANSTLSFKESWALGSNFKMKLFINSLLLALPSIIIVFFLAISIIIGIVSLANPLLAILFFILAFVLVIALIVYAVLASLVKLLSDRFIVLEKMDNMDAISAGYQFLKKNWQSIAVAYLIYICANILSSALFFPISLLMMGILMPILMLFALNPLIGIVLILITQLIASLLGSLLSGPINALVSIYWTNTYLEIKKS